MNRITIDDVMRFVPCYDLSEVQEMAGRRKDANVLEILKMRKVPDRDKLWLVLREELIPAETLHRFAIWCAYEVLPVFEAEYPDDDRPRKAIEAKEKWLAGEISDKQLAAARWAASDAAHAARWAASEAALWAARWAASEAAHAASDAARWAASEAASDAARWAASEAALWAASEAASDAARWAASDAAHAASYAALWAAIYKKQVKQLIKMLEAK